MGWPEAYDLCRLSGSSLIILESGQIGHLALEAELKVDELHLTERQPFWVMCKVKWGELQAERERKTEQMHREKQRCQEKVSVKSERQKDREGGRDQGHRTKENGAWNHPPWTWRVSWHSPDFGSEETWLTIAPILGFLWGLWILTAILPTWAYVSGPLLRPPQNSNFNSLMPKPFLLYLATHPLMLSFTTRTTPTMCPQDSWDTRVSVSVALVNFPLLPSLSKNWVTASKPLATSPTFHFRAYLQASMAAGVAITCHHGYGSHLLRLLAWSVRDPTEWAVSPEHCLLSHSYKSSHPPRIQM